MPTTTVSTQIPPSVSQEEVLNALHNHQLMIRTLCPALVGYVHDAGDPTTQATYSITDKKPIGQVSNAVRMLQTSFGTPLNHTKSIPT